MRDNVCDSWSRDRLVFGLCSNHYLKLPTFAKTRRRNLLHDISGVALVEAYDLN